MSQIHALIVDDNRLNIQVLETLLGREGLGYTSVDFVRQVPAALDSLERVDIVFLDLEFPIGDGFTLLGQLKNDSRLVGVPIVAYSVHTSEIDVVRRAGFHSFIGKPLDAHQFPAQLQHILAGKGVWEV